MSLYVNTPNSHFGPDGTCDCDGCECEHADPRDMHCDCGDWQPSDRDLRDLRRAQPDLEHEVDVATGQIFASVTRKREADLECRAAILYAARRAAEDL